VVQIHSPRLLFLESATCNTRKSEVRLVRGQEVDGSNPRASAIYLS
jgi:hypothetical protein